LKSKITYHIASHTILQQICMMSVLNINHTILQSTIGMIHCYREKKEEGNPGCCEEKYSTYAMQYHTHTCG